MKIGIDARVLSNDKPTGIGNCVIQTLKYIASLDDSNEYFLFSNEKIIEEYIYSERFHPIVIPSKSSSIWVVKELTRELPKYNVDIFWGTLHLLPRNNNIRKILTIYDLALMINPRWGNLKNAIIQNTLVKASIKRADQIIVISQSTKRDVVEKFGISDEKVSIAFPGFKMPSDDRQMSFVRKDIFDLSNKNYLLYVGTIEPRKNLINVIKAFNIIKEDYPAYQLVLAGKLGWNYSKILKKISTSKYHDSIHQIGYISNDEKTCLYRNAKAFLFPSYYEGFGIPVIEAISFGLPVLTTNNSSLTEAAGPSEFYIENPDDYNEIAKVMKQILSTPRCELQKRNADSKNYINNFSWESFSKTIYRVIIS